MKKILTTGTFDLLHIGHINLLKRARELGDYLIVGLNDDDLIAHKKPINDFETRKAMLEAIKYVEMVVRLHRQEDKLDVIRDLQIDEFVVGSDYKGFKDIPDIEKLCKVTFLERTPDISTTKLKEIMSGEHKTYVIDIDDTICHVENRDFLNATPYQDVINKINEIYELGYKIILLTARGMKSQNNNPELAKAKYDAVTRAWLKANNVKYHELLFGKPNADAYVDDKAMSIDKFLSLKLR